MSDKKFTVFWVLLVLVLGILVMVVPQPKVAQPTSSQAQEQVLAVLRQAADNPNATLCSWVGFDLINGTMDFHYTYDCMSVNSTWHIIVLAQVQCPLFKRCVES